MLVLVWEGGGRCGAVSEIWHVDAVLRIGVGMVFWLFRDV